MIAPVRVAGRRDQLSRICFQLRDAGLAVLGSFDEPAQIDERRGGQLGRALRYPLHWPYPARRVSGRARDSAGCDPPGHRTSPAPLVKSPLSSLRPSPRSIADLLRGANLSSLSIARSTVRRAAGFVAGADRLHHAVEHLAVVDLDDVVAALDAERLHRVGSEHADLGIGRDRSRYRRYRHRTA